MLQRVVENTERMVKDIMSGMHTAMPAEIVAIDEETMLLDLQPVASYYVGNIEMEYPMSPGIPLCITANNDDIAACCPIAVGDVVLYICTEQSISAWLTETSEAQLNEKFELQNGVAIPFPQKAPVEAQREANEKKAYIIKAGETKVTIEKEKVTIETMQAEIMADEVKIDAPATHITGETRIDGKLSVGGQVSAGGQISGPSANITGTVSCGTINPGSCTLGGSHG